MPDNDYYNAKNDYAQKFQDWLNKPSAPAQQAQAAQPSKPLGQEINENLATLQQRRRQMAQDLYKQRGNQ